MNSSVSISIARPTVVRALLRTDVERTSRAREWDERSGVLAMTSLRLPDHSPQVALDTGRKDGWIGTRRPSRRSLRDLLRVRTLFNAIKNRPHAEERWESASRSTHEIDAALPRRSLCGRRSSAGRLIVQCRLMGKDEIKEEGFTYRANYFRTSFAMQRELCEYRSRPAGERVR